MPKLIELADFDSLSLEYTMVEGTAIAYYRLTFIDGTSMLFNTYEESKLYSSNPLRKSVA